MSFDHVKAGDEVMVGLAGGRVVCKYKVSRVDDTLIYCEGPENGLPEGEEGWMYDRETGMEVDELLRFGPKHGITGTYLLP